MVDASALGPVVLVYGILFLVVLRRSVLMARGTPYRETRLIVTALVYVALFALTALNDLLILPGWTLGVDVAVLAAGAVVATRYVERAVAFHRGADGVRNYRLGLALPVLFLALFALRLVVELVVLNIDPFAPPTSLHLTALQTAELAGIGALFALSAGLLVGRSIGVIRAAGRRPASEDPPMPVSAG